MCTRGFIFCVGSIHLYKEAGESLSLSLSFYLSISMTLSLSVCRLNVTHSDFQNAT